MEIRFTSMTTMVMKSGMNMMPTIIWFTRSAVMDLNAGMNMTPITIRFTSRTTVVGRSGGSMTPRVMKSTSRTTMAMKSGITPKETAFIYGTMKVKNGLPKATKKEGFADKDKKNPSSMSFIMSFTVYFSGDLQYEGTLNLNDGTINIYYTKKSIKNTLEGVIFQTIAYLRNMLKRAWIRCVIQSIHS